MTPILFAPDYRAGLPYQASLARALEPMGYKVAYLSHYKRGLPLARGIRTITPAPAALHLHWPEVYFKKAGDWFDRLRPWRFPADLARACRSVPLFLTAHNLYPHNRWEEPGVPRAMRAAARRAAAVFVHSDEARRQFSETFGIPEDRCRIIPYGDHAIGMVPPLDPHEARRALELPRRGEQAVALVFGTVSPYKGSDAVVRHWVERRIPHRLVIAGPVLNEAFADELRSLAKGSPAIDLRLSEEWLTDVDLRLWLSAVDCAVFNYREIFTSGAAALARSFGLPLLVPERLKCADLDEPHSHVFRFQSLGTDFDDLLAKAVSIPPDFALAEPWRRRTSWENVARLTAETYAEFV